MSPVVALTLDLLLDTHIVIWLATDPDRIPAYMLDAFEHGRRRFVSHISALEIQIKHRKSPEQFGFSLEMYEAAMKEFGLEELPLTYADIKASASMEFTHQDPFDRLLMAQAMTRNLRVLTLDSEIIKTANRFKTFHVVGGL